jgi:hypothetical protein
MLEGLFQPRQSAQRIVLARYGAETGIAFIVLAYVLQAILQIVLPGARTLPEGVEGLPMVLHLLNMLVLTAVAGMLSLAIFGVGRAFGGSGSRRQAFVLVSWHTLVTTLLAPVFLIGMAQVASGAVSPVVMGLMIAAGTIWLWVLAAYTAVLHGFRSPWGVMGVMLGTAFLISSIFATLVPAA